MPVEALVHALIVGAVIARLRQRRKVTQAEFARRAGLSQPTLSRIERGKAQPSPNDLRVISQLLDVSPGELVATVEVGFVRLGDAVKRMMGKEQPPWAEALELAGVSGLAGLAAFAAAAAICPGGPHAG